MTNEASTSSEDSPKQKRLNRNKRNNRNKYNNKNANGNSKESKNASHSVVNSTNAKNSGGTKNCNDKHDAICFRALEPPLRQHTKLNLTECQLVEYLKHYLLDETLLRLLGFPVEYENLAIIYKYTPYEFLAVRKDNSMAPAQTTTYYNTTATTSSAHANNNNNQNYFYYASNSDQIIINSNDGLVKDNLYTIDSDSGQGSGSSSPSVEADYEISNSSSNNAQPVIQSYTASSQKQCIRCGNRFCVTYDGDYLTEEHCVYHWGKLYRTFSCNQMKYVYSCCNREFQNDVSNGCTQNRFHVWTGLSSGLNGPYDGFVRTQKRPSKMEKKSDVYALDCEMCFTGCGLELTKVTIIKSDGSLFYQTFVRPAREIVDYNTRFSGITEENLFINSSRRSSITSTASSKSTNKSSCCNTVKSLQEVQKDILKFIFEDSILIGHSLENDLRALKLIHSSIIDTSISFPHFYGLPYRRSLKALTKSVLKREIQQSENGHCSFEDSRACLELMLWKVRKDFRHILERA